jgi:hypothetical protein
MFHEDCKISGNELMSRENAYLCDLDSRGKNKLCLKYYYFRAKSRNAEEDTCAESPVLAHGYSAHGLCVALTGGSLHFY